MIKISSKTLSQGIKRFFKILFSTKGLIISLCLGILVSLLGFLIQDQIQRQRYLELLEFEIRENYLTATNEMKTFNQTGIIYTHTPFHDDVYKAGLQTGYLLTIKDPDILSSIYSLYDEYLPKVNKLGDQEVNTIDLYSNKWAACISDNLYNMNGKNNTCNKEKQTFDEVQRQYSGYINTIDQQVAKTTYSIGLRFNPTQDRLHSWWMKRLMGDKALKIQE